MKTRAKMASIAIAGLLGAAGALFAAAPAQAAVWDCNTGINHGNQGWATCFSGMGWYRVVVDCANVGRVVTVSGDWQYRDDTTGSAASLAGCGGGFATNVRVDTH